MADGTWQMAGTTESEVAYGSLSRSKRCCSWFADVRSKNCCYKH